MACCRHSHLLTLWGLPPNLHTAQVFYNWTAFTHRYKMPTNGNGNFWFSYDIGTHRQPLAAHLTTRADPHGPLQAISTLQACPRSTPTSLARRNTRGRHKTWPQQLSAGAMVAAYRGLSSPVIAPCTAVVCVVACGPGSRGLHSRAPAPFRLCRLADASEWSQHRPGAPFQSSIEPLMLEYQVDLLITGHQHCLERIHPVHNGTNLECASCRVCVCVCLLAHRGHWTRHSHSHDLRW